MAGRHRQEGDDDVSDDSHVASSRADDTEDGSYVGRTFSDDAIDAGETGAEARSGDGT